MGEDSHKRTSEMDTSKEELLPKHVTHIVKPVVERSTSNDLLFRCYIICSMTLIWTGYTIMVRYTRSTTPAPLLYSSTTVVLMSEIVKLLITLSCLFWISNCDVSEFARCLNDELLGKPLDLVKMSVPSIMYAIQNNLDFVALSHLDAGTYQVTTQLKVVTTAIFMMLILGRRFSARRWLAITLLFVGVAAVQLNAVEGQANKQSNTDGYVMGLSAVLMTCATAGFAGVYFEMMLKDGSSAPLWIRNLQMYGCGVISALTACYLTEWDSIQRRGFFYGYSYKVTAIILLLSFGGIYISLVMKYLDNLYKSFASAVSIILVVIISLFLFEGVHIGFYFIVGSLGVCGAIMLYNSVDE